MSRDAGRGKIGEGALGDMWERGGEEIGAFFSGSNIVQPGSAFGSIWGNDEHGGNGDDRHILDWDFDDEPGGNELVHGREQDIDDDRDDHQLDFER